MTITHSEAVTASQSDQDHDPAIEFVIRLHAAAKAGRALLEAVESDDLDADITGRMRDARAAYDRLAETEQRASA